MRLARASCALALLLLPGAVPGARAAEPPLHVSVAVSLRPALEDALEAYRVEAPDVRFLLNSGASGVLLRQVRQGAPADVMISASPREIDLLVQQGLALAETRRRIATNGLVVVVSRNAASPAGLDGLAGRDYGTIAVGNPKTAPLGRYTRQALEAAGLWARLESRLVFAENARQTLEYVARDEVDAGVVYLTDARLVGDRVRVGPAIAPGLHDPIAYDGVVLAETTRRAEATAFVEWLASGRGRETLARHDFPAP